MTPKLQPLPPIEAIAFFRSKGLTSAFSYQDVWQDEHAKAFTVAKMMNRDLLEDTRKIVEKAIAEGKTFEQFRDELKPKLQAADWWGRQKVVDPADGEEKLVQLGSDRRLRTIFDVNLRSAYAHGQWQRIERTKERFPFLMYDAVDDGRTRPEHRAMDGHIARVDASVWDRWCPPCGWRCRCDLIQLTERMAKAQGGESPEIRFQPQVFTNRRTGEVTIGDKGIDPGFNFNIGKSPLRPLSVNAPATVAPPKGSEAAVESFLRPFKAEDKPQLLNRKDGWPVVVGKDMFTDKGGNMAIPRPDLIDRLPDVARALGKPDKAEWVWRTANATELATPAEVRSAVDAALSDTKAFPRVSYGFVSTEVTDAARSAGLNLYAFRHSLTGDKIRHINRRHGSDPDGKQFDITADDIASLDDVVAAPDVVIFGVTTARGRPAMISIKQFGNSTKIYFEEISHGKWELMPHTFYHREGKVPAEVNVPSLLKSLNLHVRSVGGVEPKIVDLRGKINAGHDARQSPDLVQLIRRYTKRLDTGETITIDFSRESWTYDIQPSASASN